MAAILTRFGVLPEFDAASTLKKGIKKKIRWLVYDFNTFLSAQSFN